MITNNLIKTLVAQMVWGGGLKHVMHKWVINKKWNWMIK